jgi:hypothetical protein
LRWLTAIPFYDGGTQIVRKWIAREASQDFAITELISNEPQWVSKLGGMREKRRPEHNSHLLRRINFRKIYLTLEMLRERS